MSSFRICYCFRRPEEAERNPDSSSFRSWSLDRKDWKTLELFLEQTKASGVVEVLGLGFEDLASLEDVCFSSLPF